jgi:hypothetical protein
LKNALLVSQAISPAAAITGSAEARGGRAPRHAGTAAAAIRQAQASLVLKWFFLPLGIV